MTKTSTNKIDLDAPTVGGDFTKPVIGPGNHILKIADIFLRPEKDTRFGTKLILVLETYPVTTSGFKGMAKSKDNPALGSYVGQVGYVSYSQFGFKNDTTPGGVEVFYKDSLMRAIGIICRNLGLTKWWSEQEFEDTDEGANEFFKYFVKSRPFEGQYFTACIGGREYLSKDGKHINYDLNFPRESRELGVPFHHKADKVLKYFEAEHLKKLEPNSGPKPTETSSEQPKTQEKAIEMVPNEPARPAHQSQAEKDFMNASPFTAEMEKEADAQKAALTGDIITGKDEPLPWEVD